MKSSLKFVFGMLALWVSAVMAFAVETSIDTRWVKSYRDKTSGVEFSSDPAVQADILFSFENGFYVDLWRSFSAYYPLSDNEVNNEVDLSVGHYQELEKFNVDVWATYLNCAGLWDLGTDDVIGLGAEITWEMPGNEDLGMGPITPCVGFESYATWANTDFEGGSLFYFGANTTFDEDSKLSKKVGYRVAYDTGTYEYDEGFVAIVEFGLEYKLSESASLVLANSLFIPLSVDDRGTGAGDQFWNPEVGFTVTF
jgi:hypothetical protein